MLRRSLRINPKDSVACLLEDAYRGDTVQTPEGETITLREEIGYMLSDAPKGTWIHMHNMGCDRGKI